MPIVVKIDVKKIDKAKLFVGKKGTYLDAVLIEKPNEYGEDGFVAMSVSREEREKGIKGEIIGSWKHLGAKPQAQTRGRVATAPPPPELNEEFGDSIPF